MLLLVTIFSLLSKFFLIKTWVSFVIVTAGAQLGGGGRPPLHYFENRKKSPDLGKKRPGMRPSLS